MIGEVAPSLPAPRTEGQVIMKPSEEGVAHSMGRSRTSRLPAAPSPLPDEESFIEPRKADWKTLTVGVKSGAVPVRIVGEVCQPLGDPGVIKVDHRQLRSAALHQRLPHLLDIKLLLLEGF